jgi:hypothetical protein
MVEDEKLPRAEIAALAASLRRYVEAGGPVAYYRRSHLDGTKRLTFDVEAERFDRKR